MLKFEWVSLVAILSVAAFPATAKLAGPKPPTAKQAFEALLAKASAGDAQAQYDVGLAYQDGRFGQKKNADAAAEWIEKAAAAGNADAQVDIADLYRTGRGVKADSAQSLSWYQKAADQGRADAALRVCAAYTQNPAVTANWDMAFPYCKAADGNAMEAQYALGVAYAEGRGTTPDARLAVAYLKKAADQGHAAALTELGEIYLIGDLVPQDYVESLVLFKKAARRGDRQAVRLMAQQYDQGLRLPADPARAAYLYRLLARDDKDADAQAWLKAHPDAPAAPDILELEKVPRDVIFYATETNDPRFQTMDIHGYFDRLSLTAYPADAQNDGVGGEATAECRFTASGDFDDCVLTRETPKDYGFGSALMRVMDRLGSSGNKTDWARRFDGKVLRVSMKWKPN